MSSICQARSHSLNGMPPLAFQRNPVYRRKATLKLAAKLLKIVEKVLSSRRSNDRDNPYPALSHRTNSTAPCSFLAVVINFVKALRPCFTVLMLNQKADFMVLREIRERAGHRVRISDSQRLRVGQSRSVNRVCDPYFLAKPSAIAAAQPPINPACANAQHSCPKSLGPGHSYIGYPLWRHSA